MFARASDASELGPQRNIAGTSLQRTARFPQTYLSSAPKSGFAPFCR